MSLESLQCNSTVSSGTAADRPPRRTLFVSRAGLEDAKRLITAYKQGQIPHMTPELWQAKKVVDSTLHPGMLFSSPVCCDL